MTFSMQFTKSDVKQPAQTMLASIIAIAAIGTSAIFADTAQANISITIRLGDRPVNTRYRSVPVYKNPYPNPYQRRTIHNPYYRSNRGDYSRRTIVRDHYNSHRSQPNFHQFPYPVNVPAVNRTLNPYYKTPKTNSYIIIR